MKAFLSSGGNATKSANPSLESPLRAKRNNRWEELGSTDFRNSTSEVGAGAGVGRVATARG